MWMHVMNMLMHSSRSLASTHEASETLSKCPIYLNFSQSIKLKKLLLPLLLPHSFSALSFNSLSLQLFLQLFHSYIYSLNNLYSSLFRFFSSCSNVHRDFYFTFNQKHVKVDSRKNVRNWKFSALNLKFIRKKEMSGKFIL